MRGINLRQIAKNFTSLVLITTLAFTIPLTAPAQSDESERRAQLKQSPGASLVISNQDVLDMHASGFSEALILARINASRSSFDISVPALQELKEAGVPDAVMLAIIGSTQTPKPSQPEPEAIPAPSQPEPEVKPIPSDPAPDSSEESAPNSFEPILLPAGTPVELSLNRTLSSEDAQKGDEVDFTVVEDVSVNGTLVIKRGAVAMATVTEANKKRRMGRAGKLNVNIDYVELLNGERAGLRAKKEAQGKGRQKHITGAIAATGIFFFPAAPFFLLWKGKDITIPEGTIVTAYIDGDVTVGSKTAKESE